MLPVNRNQRLIGLLGMSNDLSDAVLMPQTLNLLVTLQTKMERIPTPIHIRIYSEDLFAMNKRKNSHHKARTNVGENTHLRPWSVSP